MYKTVGLFFVGPWSYYLCWQPTIICSQCQLVLPTVVSHVTFGARLARLMRSRLDSALCECCWSNFYYPIYRHSQCASSTTPRILGFILTRLTTVVLSHLLPSVLQTKDEQRWTDNCVHIISAICTSSNKKFGI